MSLETIPPKGLSRIDQRGWSSALEAAQRARDGDPRVGEALKRTITIFGAEDAFTILQKASQRLDETDRPGGKG